MVIKITDVPYTDGSKLIGKGILTFTSKEG